MSHLSRYIQFRHLIIKIPSMLCWITCKKLVCISCTTCDCAYVFTLTCLHILKITVQ